MDGRLVVMVVLALALALVAGLAWRGVRRRRAPRALTREERLLQARRLSRKTSAYSKKNVRRTKPGDVGSGASDSSSSAADGSGTPF